MNLLQLFFKIVYYTFPLFFTLPCLISVLLRRRKSIEKAGKERFMKRLERWAGILHVCFILEAFLTMFFIIFYGLGEAAVGAVHLIFILLSRTVCFTFLKGYESGVIDDKEL